MKRTILKATVLHVAAAVVIILTLSCSQSKKQGILEGLPAVYTEMAMHNQEITENTQRAMNTKNMDERNSIMEENVKLAQQYMEEDKALVEKAAAMGRELEGRPVDIVAAEGSGVTISDGTIEHVKAGKVANIVIKAKTSGTMPRLMRCQMLDEEGNVLTESMASGTDDSVTLTIQLYSIGRNPEKTLEHLSATDRITKIRVLTE
ncbi:MAG: hypothetical protein NC344_08585 [Bacteroidales bacterium]|nr:hypothetical protein [Bacteroidales bacterium]MCM1147866.1 hypothetical protein [Bacteroidales bacterium]MCM1206709.1 hypothetical protein [Bacillota bacterium]MCM1510905.1 hypothetical protein [Clostridium sp.]